MAKNLDDRNTPLFIGDCYTMELAECYTTKFMPASHWLVRREVFERIGGFSPVFIHYGEDSNLVLRARYFGYEMALCPHCMAVHDMGCREQTPERMMFFEYLTMLIDINDINRNFLSRLPMSYLKLLINGFRIKAPLGLKMKYALKPAGTLVASVRNRRLTRQAGEIFI